MRKFLKIILLFFISISVFSQGVCDLTAGVEKGGFDFDGPSAVCIGEKVKIKNTSGVTDVKYIYGYKGEAASRLPSIPATTDTEWPFLAAGEYLILQYGKKNGKDMYFCRVATVRKNTEPVFSYSDCNNNQIEIAISNVPANNFDYYTIDWGDGSALEKVNPTQLPYKKTKGLTTPRTITVNGVFATASSCQSSSSKTIPYRDPRVPGFTGYDTPNAPNIKQVILKEADEAILTINGSYDPAGYNLFMTERGTPYSKVPTKRNVLPGDISIPIPDTTKSYCFYLTRNNTCGYEESAEICTVILSDVQPSDSYSQKIIWEEYPKEMSHETASPNYGLFMNSTTKLMKEEDDVPAAEKVISGGVYVDNVNCRNKYCYRIKTETSGQMYYYKFSGTSISKQMCLDREDFHPPAITDALVSVNAANASEITFTDNSSWQLKKDKFILYRNNGTAFTEVKTSPTISTITDTGVDNSQQSNCYKIAYLDECGSTSALSPPFCTVLLTEGNKNELVWTAPSPFADTGVQVYEVESLDENTGAPSREVSLSGTQLNYSPDLSKFQEEARYRIKIIAPDKNESYSNIYVIPLSIKILLPDIFTPNNDNFNDNLEVKGTFRRIANFELQIYNRWGNPVFTSDDPLKTWDGNFQGSNAPVDTYTYKIYAKLTDGTEVNKTGKFLLMR
ncbi:gliding motility-associated C-terminal domain-containing protein [Emticicia sp. 17c]|uniref:gliding motility-associated C-terminal domain-containing protein n=1 Tax=Emticicia sp. 17c TaxID=3127704 RepID=UPI00301D439B